MLTRCSAGLLLLTVTFPPGKSMAPLSHAVCVANATMARCDEWNLRSSWTQGGYHAECKMKSSHSKYHLTVFIVRNVYSCNNASGRDVVKIVNSYFDNAGKLCHLIKGDEVCPGISDSLQLKNELLSAQLYCGNFQCNMHYHRCEICPLVPWYTWMPAAKMRKRMSCKRQSLVPKTTKKRVGKLLCVKCNGKNVDKKYCEPTKTTKYFVDLASSKPSWSEWMQSSECRTNTTRTICGNGTLAGTTLWTKHCLHAGSKVKLDPKYCGSSDSSVIVHCEVKLPPCLGLLSSKKMEKSLKSTRVWLIVLLVGLVIAFVAAIWIYFKYLRLKSKTERNNSSFWGGTDIFSSCATQTSPHYSPTRIISEPEYALLGDWRHNVAKYPQTRREYSFADDDSIAFWGSDQHSFSDDNLSDSTEENEMVDSHNAHNVARSHPQNVGRYRPKERCELEASKRRALFAKK